MTVPLPAFILSSAVSIGFLQTQYFKKSSVFRYMRQTDNNRTPADIASGQKTRRKNYSASTLRALAKKKLRRNIITFARSSKILRHCMIHDLLKNSFFSQNMCKIKN
jgi:hypothetical protein